jgi:hypothetical protein
MDDAGVLIKRVRFDRAHPPGPHARRGGVALNDEGGGP